MLFTQSEDGYGNKHKIKLCFTQTKRNPLFRAMFVDYTDILVSVCKISIRLPIIIWFSILLLH